MESASKRKAGNVALSPGEGRPAKRQKAPAASGETAESTTEMGLKFLDGLKQAKDKTGRPIAVHFMTLPDKDELPDYFEFTKLPLALDSIEEKLNNGEYTSLAQVESDCKRLVNNAKAYNDKKSIIYEDAERLRKTASNWMVKHNPAYRDGNYVAVATPVPGGEVNVPPGKPIPRIASTPRAAATPTPASAVATERPRRAAALAQPETPVPLKPRQSTSAAPESRSTGTRGASTPSFQHAQEQIIQEIIDHKDPGGDLAIFQPFLNLPTRALKDYYQLIKDPMSLAAIKKKVQGVVGRDAPTGHTLFKSWDAFESAMSLVWSNARIYNEDGSELYNLSLELEETFKEKLRAMRARVDEPPQPKLKLNMSGAAPSPAPKPNLKLKLRQSPVSGSNTPNARDSATPGVIVDNEALQRQQRHVNDSMGGRRSRPTDKAATPVASNPFSGTRGPSTIITPVLAAQARNAGSPVANGVKQDVQSPALSAIRPGSNAPDSQRMSVPAHTPLPAMAPPQVMSRPPSGSPHPNGLYSQQNGLSTPGFQQPTPYIPPSIPRTDVFRKVPLKKLNEALIPSLTLNTHPALNLPHPWTITIPASKTKTHHSATINLSPTHSYLQITPKVPIALTGRMYRLYVQVNSNKTFEVNRVPVTAGINGSSESTGFEGGKKKGEPVFEAKLVGGVNRIEVDIIAEKALRDGETASGKDNTVEIEKYTVFLHLARQGY